MWWMWMNAAEEGESIVSIIIGGLMGSSSSSSTWWWLMRSKNDVSLFQCDTIHKPLIEQFGCGLVGQIIDLGSPQSNLPPSGWI